METEDICPLPVVYKAVRTTKKLLTIYYLITLHVLAGFLIIDKIGQMYTIQPRAEDSGTASPSPVSEVTPMPSIPADTAANRITGPTPRGTEPPPPAVLPSGLIIPVQGVKPEQLIDSFADARSEGRVHDALDIMAPAGTPVLAAADGEILKFYDSKAGGTTIYELSTDKKFIYYYAHLQRRADDVQEGLFVKQGRVIAFVGDTGNAGPGNYHLHFGISAVTDPKRFWDGTPVNPYPLLRR
jgi:murein DD-endopeptidase MepM/ murein hydrolase activator NlpD